MQRIEKVLLVENKLGLHARAATQLTQLASSWQASITIEKDGKTASANSVLGIMMLEASQNKQVTVLCEGPDAHDAMAAISELFSSKFNEAE